MTAVENAIAQWCTPLCITPEVLNCSAQTYDVEIDVYVLNTVSAEDATIEAAALEAIQAMNAAVPIAGYDGELDPSLIVGAVTATYPQHIYKISVTSPAAPVVLTAGEVAVLDDVTITVHQTAP